MERPEVMDIEILLDKRQLDIEMLHNYLSNDAYWAQGRTLDVILKSIKNSICFGMYNNGVQIGFARVVTDYAIFGWIMDLFIIDEHQGKKLGNLLMGAILNHPELYDLNRWGLTTRDAHGFYERFGFIRVGDSPTHMERVK